MAAKSAATPKAKPAPRLPLKEPVLRPSFRRERRWLAQGVFPVAGCDEAGRGPLAGPVVAAAVVLDPERVPRGLNDSKKLDADEREKLYEKICASAQVAVAFGSIERIDRDNILRASLWALARAVKALPVAPRLVYVDGNIKIGYGFERHMGYSVPEHFDALARLGPTIHHRKSFAPVAAKLAALGGASDEVVVELLPL